MTFEAGQPDISPLGRGPGNHARLLETAALACLSSARSSDFEAMFERLVIRQQGRSDFLPYIHESLHFR